MFITVLYCVLGSGLLLLLLLLVLPVSYSFCARYKGENTGAFACRIYVGSPLFKYWMEQQGTKGSYRSVFLGLPLGKKQWPGEKKTQKEKKLKQSSQWSFSQIRGFLTGENFRHILKFVYRFLPSLKPRHLNFRVRLGLMESEWNAWLLAAYYALKGLYAEIPLHWETSWGGEEVELEGTAGGRVIPALLLYRLAMFIVSRQTLRMLWGIWKIRGKNMIAGAT